MDRHYRKLALRFYRLIRHPKRQRSSGIYRWLGQRVFDRRLWVPERHSFAKGMSLGMFFAMTPPFTPQMVCAAIVCMWRKWNVPISMAMCWLTNVFTLVPQIYLQTKFGLWTLELFVHDAGKAGIAVDMLEDIIRIWHADGAWQAVTTLQNELGGVLAPLALPYTIGVVLSCLIGAILGFTGGHALWLAFAHRVPVRHKVPHRSHPADAALDKRDQAP